MQNRQSEELLRQFMLTNPLNSMLRSLNIVSASASTSTSRETAQQPTKIPPCPGLNRRDIGDFWVVPVGESSADVTYCMECSKKYGLVGEPYRNSGTCNCDSYMIVNKIDNGIFNISFWSEDLSTFYTNTNRNSDGSFNLGLKYGEKFTILVHGRLKKTQCYKYTIKINDGETEKVLHQETSYNLKTIIPRKDGKNINCIFLKAEMPGLEFLSNNNIVTERCKLIFLFDIYEYKSKDFGEYKNRFFGSFKLNQNDNPVYKTLLDQNQETLTLEYDGKPQPVLPHTNFVKFTKIPLAIKVNLHPTSDNTEKATQVLYTLLKSTQSLYRRELRSLNEQKDTITDKIIQYTDDLDDLKQNIQICKEQQEAINAILNTPYMAPLPTSDVEES